ncbi:hypothetical protein DF268_06780 [Streptomyces sp. V2]|uniref:hypothetical protein n=1 Tax=Streptomyces sp. V2 TaxID=1424099 RepID=UPI00099EA749|nr:hypothetical protein [Streptomyces sp. V2]PWG14248.1 hypothetical protein DF268_06780 [Streptomyces sp. V2]
MIDAAWLRGLCLASGADDAAARATSTCRLTLLFASARAGIGADNPTVAVPAVRRRGPWRADPLGVRIARTARPVPNCRSGYGCGAIPRTAIASSRPASAAESR